MLERRRVEFWVLVDEVYCYKMEVLLDEREIRHGFECLTRVIGVKRRRMSIWL